ncbi:hypothetical protein BJ742DRAFT_799390 [Cladochytrium replicatum]|nr:hypothetical protein BJ742DRAFT_799390 [Cladochytrium replicatum]
MSSHRKTRKSDSWSRKVYQFHPSAHLRTNPTEQLRLQRQGLDYFNVFFGPASGPRIFTTCGFEKAVRAAWSQGRFRDEKWLVGASASSLRFAALIASIATNRNITNQIKEHFCEMMYKHGDTTAVLRPMMEEMYRIAAPEEALDAILGHQNLRLAILVGNVREPYRSWPEWGFRAAFLSYAIGNVVHPEALRGLLSRVCFYTGNEPPTFLENGLGGKEGIEFVRLTKENLYPVFHATTCIPFVQEPIEYIPGYGKGHFIDGAATDYMLNSILTSQTHRGLLLSDKFDGVVRRTAFDIYVPWRNLPPEFRSHCSVVCPDPSFIDTLPERKMPNVGDWFKREYIERPALRQENWKATYNLSTRNFVEGLFVEWAERAIGSEGETTTVEEGEEEELADEMGAREGLKRVETDESGWKSEGGASGSTMSGNGSLSSSATAIWSSGSQVFVKTFETAVVKPLQPVYSSISSIFAPKQAP